MKKILTQKDIDTLTRALELKEKYNCGIYGNFMHMSKLVKQGYLEFAGRTDSDIDGLTIGERWMFKLTKYGSIIANSLNNGELFKQYKGQGPITLDWYWDNILSLKTMLREE